MPTTVKMRSPANKSNEGKAVISELDSAWIQSGAGRRRFMWMNIKLLTPVQETYRFSYL